MAQKPLFAPPPETLLQPQLPMQRGQGLKLLSLFLKEKLRLGKLAQAMIHGSTIIQIKGNFDDGMQLVKEVAEFAPVSIVNSINPFRLQGQKTAAFEIIEELGHAPDYHCLPVGNAGNITAHWMGYTEYFETGKDLFNAYNAWLSS